MEAQEKIKYLESFAESTYKDLIDMGFNVYRVLDVLGVIDVINNPDLNEDEIKAEIGKAILKNITAMAVPDPRDTLRKLAGMKVEKKEDPLDFIVDAFAPLFNKYYTVIGEYKESKIISMPSDYVTIKNQSSESSE